MPEPPITGAELDRWAAQFPDAPDRAVEALLAAGISRADLRRWQRIPRTRAQTPPLLRWRLDRRRLQAMSVAEPDLGLRELGDLAAAITGDEPLTDRPFLRLEVTGDAIPTDVIPRLLRNTVVDSAIVAAGRAPGALKPREWSWPLRVGFIGFEAASVRRAIRRTTERPPAAQIDFRDLRVEPAALDILVALGPLDDAVRGIIASRQVTNAVIVLDDAPGRWPLVDAQLGVLRAATAAVVSVLAPLPAPDQPAHRQTAALARSLGVLIRLMSVGEPFDVAVTAAFDHPIVVGEVEALQDDADLGAILQRATEGLRASIQDRAPSLGLDFEKSFGPLPRIPRASWVRPSLALDELQPRISEIRDAVDAALPAPPLRYLQCTVTPIATKGAAASPNTVRSGPNEVTVFVGPPEQEALHGGDISDAALGFVGTDAASARVTVVLAPLIPRAEPVSTELDVPREGRSANRALIWQIPTTMKRHAAVSARLIVVFRNRVLQTAVLSGTVGGTVTLQEQVLLRSDWSDLNDRKPFDAAIVRNHDHDGHEAMIVKVDDGVAMARLSSLTPITDEIGRLLVAAASIKGKAPKKRLDTLIALAQKGSDYWVELQRVYRSVASQLVLAQRVQLLTLESPRLLPLELAYTRVPPLGSAKLCPFWEQGGDTCGPGCGDGENDQSIVCPAAFWGMSRILERYYADVTAGGPPVVLQKVDPKANKRKLAVDNALVAASRVVSSSDTAETVRQLPAGTALASSWEDWKIQLASGPAKNLLVLLAHNATGPALEISGQTLQRPMLLDGYVTGGRGDEINPVVLLFGCDTAGLAADPSGWSMRFLDRHAAVVFSTLTMLYGKDAARMAQIMANLLKDPSRGEESVGALTQRFRREAYRAGLISALGVASYGDTDWTVV
ncbi:hypothetical protein BayCH28_10040 [Mycolicibacterium sp. CH28]|uniref:hypothetical protein n=1 Tax=Mycolicibacterium sp. CH28 TaxID=2512237 RepID=UPI001082134E|nr:hypothetical protein [Mycolicibacterium sp. CH28]TGD88107.1 hypothetical protein BayCH28_10040 [Mycolicibacterium sp. CH28]